MMFADYTTDVIGTTSFGVSSDATLNGESALRTVTKDFMRFSVYRGLCWSSIFFFPELVDFFGFTMFPKSAADYFRRVYRLVVAERGGYHTDINENGDLLDALRFIKKKSIADLEDIAEDTLIAQGAIFLQAGFDTTATTLAFCAYELSYQPHLQEKLYNELNEAKVNKGDKDFDPTKVMYLLCVLNETLRKYTAMGWLDRIASSDYRIDEELVIPTGTPVYINAVGMHHDANIYPEPIKFDPDRFLPENVKNIKPFTYMPFGEGPRNCIGRRFAIQNFAYALSNVILNYKIRSIPDMPLPSEVEIEKKGFFYNPGEQLFVQFLPRN